MDDYELDRIASDNPALTTPAAQRAPISRQRVRGGTRTSTTSKPVTPEELTKYDVGWRRVVRNFSPSWFSVTMGTGIVSLLFVAIPFKADWLFWLSVFFFGLNTILFSCAFSISVFRYVVYPEIWTVMIADSVNSLFLGTIPMGFATLVSAWCSLCIPYWGPWAVTFAWVCWMIDSVVAVSVTISLTVLLISASNRQALDRITAAQLLPIAASIVAAGTGARVAEHLPNPEHALGTILASYIMWGTATPLAMTVLVMYYTRLALHKLPPREIVVSSFLPLGPLGMGGYSITHLGLVGRQVFPKTQFLASIPVAGDIFFVLGVFIALIMWAFGLTWLCFALASIYKSRPFPFNMGWWGFTFPLGVMALSTIELGNIFPSLFFRVLGTMFATSVVFLWCVVAVGTARGAWKGHLFYAPCLKNLPKKEIIGETEAQKEKGQL
ncbi:TehA Tellurite resistance protein [Pyrenophora tritici-repentis]|uniref:Sulfite transporter Ssu2 n=2 Tax=Pyrenophora tritici-repentis TaxID=45151 RepID=A0A2W1HMB2_9PLEO|nr:sulfite transporter Ssu2 [Pyrenophora tritici-repentis Pt-1C-BFP]KAA8626120.1 Sulfite transporter Ssu2 [Pyrenophora tritici-repentis]EDU40902.1 sulfite transporter Ssu2 [Pyrenophora tritici-repentis Pt-1C-BFP]KAF7454534.1 Sulfite transporter Ssu2 [Pyrenophora tritici-repentis]KAI0578890.1 Sulfite transporter Ssu2 [Pyrenophora tritici-repentis]KAI0583812.1 Sulfite transporter Ssu2 [Pyrenophora tritici-repentis]